MDFYCEGGEVLEWNSQKSRGCPIPGNVPGAAWNRGWEWMAFKVPSPPKKIPLFHSGNLWDPNQTSWSLQPHISEVEPPEAPPRITFEKRP